MLYVDVSTRSDIVQLGRLRADACVSLFVGTTPVTQQMDVPLIAFTNLGKEALRQLEAIGFDKHRSAIIAEQMDELLHDDDFWTHQAHSLCVFATAETLRSYRVASRLTTEVHVSDRFHLKPLLRNVTFRNSGLVLALPENVVRLIRISARLPTEDVRLRDLPRDAASYAGKSTLNDRTDVMRPVLKGEETPLILATTKPLASIYRSINSYAQLATEGLATSPGEMTPAQLADTARPVLDGIFSREAALGRKLMEQRVGQGRTILDVSDAARAATAGAVDTLLVDIDKDVPGFVDDVSELVTIARKDNARTYDILDEIAVRSLLTGARVLAVRTQDTPDFSAITRYAV